MTTTTTPLPTFVDGPFHGQTLNTFVPSDGHYQVMDHRYGNGHYELTEDGERLEWAGWDDIEDEHPREG